LWRQGKEREEKNPVVAATRLVRNLETGSSIMHDILFIVDQEHKLKILEK
jgi:hypothetical protein